MGSTGIRQEIRDKAARHPFTLPPGITKQKKVLSDGNTAYVFRHLELGELGRVILIPHHGGTQFSYELAGESNDPMLEERRKIFEPLAKELGDYMGFICGPGTDQIISYAPPIQKQIVGTQIMPCHHCHAPAAIMIMAPDAHTVDVLEDYARRTCSLVREHNVPTWIVGHEREVEIDGKLAGEAWVLKVWPDRVPAEIMYSEELNEIFDACMENHCDA